MAQLAKRRAFAVVAMAGVLLLGSAIPAAAQTADSASAEAWGAEIRGAVDFGPEPAPVTAEVPPGETDSDEFLEVPAEPLVLSATLAGEVEASQQANLPAKLADVIDGATDADLPEAWNSRGHAITEDLGVLFAEGGGGEEDPVGELGENPEQGDDVSEDDLEGELDDGDSVEPETAEAQQQQEEPLLTAEVVESEAVASCEGGQLSVASGSRIERLTFAGEEVDALDPAVELLVQGEPNEDVLANTPGGEALAELGLEVTAWETNWDGESGTTDGSDTVWVNALHVSVVEGSPLADAVGEQDVTVSHGEASADCDGVVGPAEVIELAKESSDETVAPGQTFTYTITVENTDPTCTLENVEVVDAISGPAGSEITSTDPPDDDIDDLTVTWSDVGPLEPGEQTTLTVDVSVPSDAADGEVYRENVSVTGECDGPVEAELPFEGPRVAAPGAEPLPETGGGMLPLGGLLLGGGALAAVLRRLSS